MAPVCHAASNPVIALVHAGPVVTTAQPTPLVAFAFATAARAADSSCKL